MAKGFFEVFPTLKLNSKLHDLMEQTTVERVSSTAKRDFLRIYLGSDKLIQKHQIWEVEQAIKEQLFKSVNIAIKIYEKFSLSAQFTPEILTDIYKESILDELKEYNHVLFTAYKNADISFPAANQMVIDCKESSLVRLMQEEFVRILDKIYVERCGLSVTFQVIYHEAESVIDRESEERALASQVAEIYMRSAKAQEEAAEGHADATVDAPADKEVSAETPAPSKEVAKSEDKAAQAPAGGKVTAGAKLQGKVTATTPGKKEWKSGGFNRGAAKKSDNPDVIYGRDFEDEPIKIEELIGEMGEVTIKGQVIAVDKRELRNGDKTMIFFDITDFTDTMTVKMFARNEDVAEYLQGICKGAFLKIKGICMIDKFDKELTIGSLAGIKKIPDFTVSRKDNAAYKRVELHCHTKMSDMDGVSDVSDIVKRAYKWGHKAIAITDHGVTQSFPIANHKW